LSVYLRGWRGYFGFCQTPSVLRELDKWTRRRLRAIVWKQWKRGRTRYAELRRCGVGRDLAASTAGSHVAPGGSAIAPPSPLLCQSSTSGRSAYLPLPIGRSHNRRTAGYGPVRPVVWEGRRRETPPYPDGRRCFRDGICTAGGEPFAPPEPSTKRNPWTGD